jgi:hypothetical protein
MLFTNSGIDIVFILNPLGVVDVIILFIAVSAGGSAKKRIVVEEIFLTDLSHVVVRRKCKVCNCDIAPLFEFGKVKQFRVNAYNVRESMPGTRNNSMSVNSFYRRIREKMRIRRVS